MKAKTAKLVSRTALIKDLQHGRFSDVAWKTHFARFKDFAAAAQPRLTAQDAFVQTVQHLDKAIDLIQKYEVDGSGWDKYQLDGVYVRIVELRELFATWQIVIEMDEDGNDLPRSEIEARLAKAKSAPLVRREMPNEKRLKQPK
jgi:hypothetical protein